MCGHQAGEEVEFELEVSERGRKALNVTGPNGEILPARQLNNNNREQGGERRSYGNRNEQRY